MNAYHNLAGWLRDARAVLNHGDRDDLGATYLAQLCDLTVELVMGAIGDEVERQLALPGYDSGPDESDADELESEDGDDGMDDIDTRGRSRASVKRTAAPSRSLRTVGGSPGLGDSLPRNVSEEGKPGRSRPAPVAGTKSGLKKKAKR